jgi:metal-responsive CopG/Arc/MetJ family transcriptional regulator
MKTAVSIPDPLFENADRLASKLGFSRSELYAVAIEAYLRDHQADTVTAALDAVYGEQPSALEPELLHVQTAILPRDRW